MKIYEQLWNEIEKKNWPDKDEIFICYDPQKRLDNWTWAVSMMGDGTLENDILQLGLFWQKGNAILFAKEKEDSK